MNVQAQRLGLLRTVYLDNIARESIDVSGKEKFIEILGYLKMMASSQLGYRVP
jgi:hypothetical protein